MAQASSITLSAFDWAIVLALAGLAWFLLVRNFRAQDALALNVQALTGEVAKLHQVMAETYVTKVDHLREVDRLETSIAGHAERWRDDLAQHRRDCPVRLPSPHSAGG
jgi:hypothetical protein